MIESYVSLQIESRGLQPSRIGITGENGIAFNFRNGKRYADIEVFSDGQICALTSDGSGNVECWECERDSLPETIDAILKHLEGAAKKEATQ